MEPFVGNDYRKRVLAAVEKRGGPGESDSFELYDIPYGGANGLAAGDVNGDGIPDALLGGAGNLGILYGQAPPTATPTPLPLDEKMHLPLISRD